MYDTEKTSPAPEKYLCDWELPCTGHWTVYTAAEDKNEL